MNTIAYLDCFSGISGDMTLGALVDLGVPVKWLVEQLEALPLNGFHIEVESVQKNGIGAKNVFVTALENHKDRNYRSISALIENSKLPEMVKKKSLDVFDRIAVAEGKIHGCSKDDVHFHEVGGIDAIIDIIGSMLGFHYLNIDKVICSKLPMGKGFVNCMHGSLPLPAPATLEILKGFPIYGVNIDQEIVTPTGAGIATVVADAFGEFPDMVIEKTGYGSGKHDIDDRPNLIRIIVGKAKNQAHIMAETMEVVETVIDDMNPEIFGYLMETLFDHGALDVNYQPVFMKKNRPGTKVEVVCRPQDRPDMIQQILSETTTTGVRYHKTKRTILKREKGSIDTEFGSIRAKKVTLYDGQLKIIPEYEECRRIAIERKMPIIHVYDAISRDMTKTK